MNMPLQIYDFIAVLFPATIFLTILRAELPALAIWQQTYQFGALAVLLVIAYVVGQFLSILSGLMERSKLTSWIFYRKKLKLISGKMILNGRKSPVIVPEKVGESILSALTDVYGFPVAQDDDGISDLVFGPVHDRMAKRDVFLALSNMLRSFVVLSVLVFIYLNVKIFIIGLANMGLNYIFVILAILSYLVFCKGYNNYKKYSEAIPYSAFLAWYKQQKMPKV